MKRTKKKPVKRIVLTIFIVLALVIVLLVAWMMWGKNQGEVVGHTFYDAAVQDAPEQEAATVYITADISPEGLIAVYEALGVEPAGNVAIKLHTGEGEDSYHLRPEFIEDFVHLVDGTLVECNTAYGGSRINTAVHMQLAEDRGYTAIAPVDIMDADGSMSLSVAGGKHLQENLVGSHLADYDFIIVLSHFKGHQMGGFGGAIKNTSIGIASSEGKGFIHTGGANDSFFFGMMFTRQNTFLESMAEAAKSVSDYENNGETIVYINVLNNISVDCGLRYQSG